MARSSKEYAALHAAVMFPTLAFIPMLMLKYNKKKVSPFEEHSFLMLALFLSIIIYTMATVTEIRCRTDGGRWYEIVSNIGLLFGPLSTISLVFIFFPNVGWALLGLWVIWFAKLAYGYFSKFRQQSTEVTQSASSVGEDVKEDESDNNQDHHSVASPSDSHV